MNAVILGDCSQVGKVGGSGWPSLPPRSADRRGGAELPVIVLQQDGWSQRDENFL